VTSLNSSELEQALLHKLRCRVDEKKKDIRYEVFADDGRLVARTWMSHSWRQNTPLGAGMLSKIKRQLQLTSLQDLVDLVKCPLTRERYFEIALAED